MSEANVELVRGVYDAKAEGFAPGGASLHNCMSAHGPDRATFEKAVAAELAGLLPRMPAEDWLSMLDRVVATPNPRRTGRAANLLDEDAAEHGPRPGSVARLLEVLHRLSDRCLSDQTILCGLYLLAEHDCEQLADSARNSVVLIRRATRYRRLAAPLL